MSMHAPEQLATLSRDRWLEVLADHVTPETEPPIRRMSDRSRVEFGVARLLYREDGVAVDRTITLLQVSAEGLMAKSPKPVPGATRLRVEVTLGDSVLALIGQVAHCTQTVGSYKVGIQLVFPAEQ